MGVQDEAKLDKTLFSQTEGLHLHCDSCLSCSRVLCHKHQYKHNNPNSSAI